MAEPIAVNSSWVRSVDYSGGLLTVVTKQGKRIVYLGVPPALWERLQGAPSKGEFINRHIRGTYKTL